MGSRLRPWASLQCGQSSCSAEHFPILPSEHAQSSRCSPDLLAPGCRVTCVLSVPVYIKGLATAAQASTSGSPGAPSFLRLPWV